MLPKDIEFTGFKPYPGWRYIIDQAGVIHHVPTVETLNRMIEALGEDWFEGKK